MDKTELLTKARAAMEMAVAPSSKFRVGAALLCDDGSVFTGCNIESPTYLGICAERVALFKALSEGRRGFTVIAIAGGANVIDQTINAGLVDELQIHLAPVLLGDGARLFDGVGPELPRWRMGAAGLHSDRSRTTSPSRLTAAK